MINLTVFYDGKCIVCDKEISFYKKANGHERIAFVDINDPYVFPNFKDKLSFSDAYKSMHAIKNNGEITKGIDAFISLWEELDYKILPKIFKNPLIRPLALLGYKLFAKVRKFLPKKNQTYCQEDVCIKEL